MRNRLFLLLCLIILSTAVGSAAIKGTVLEPVCWHTSKAPNIETDKITIDNLSTRLTASGGYDLPMIVKNFRYPVGSTVHGLKINMLETSHKQLSAPLAKLPSKPTLDGSPLSNTPVTNPLMGDTFYPNCWTEVDVRQGLDPQTLQPTIFATVRIYPVRVHGTLMQYITEIDCALNVSPAPETNHRDGSGMLVIAPQAFTAVMGNYITHKTGAGHAIIVETVEDILASGTGRDDAEKIKNAIADAYSANDLTFVLLAGDADQIPVRYAFHFDHAGRPDWQNIPADLYYADLYNSDGEFCDWDGNGNGIFGEYNNGNIDNCDFAPDVLIGRIPASTAQELNATLAKTIHYETSVTGSEEWQNRIVLAGADTFTAEEHGDVTGYPEGEVTKELIADESLTGYDLIKLYETERYSRTDELTTATLASAIENGARYVNFANHGNVQAWAFNELFTVNDADALTNYDHLPLIFAYACSTGVFDTENEECPSFGVDRCLAESFILNPSGGAVGYYGASRTAFAGGHGLGGHLGAFGLFDRMVFKGISDGHVIQGHLWQYALMELLLGKGLSDPVDFISILELHYFGDPSVAAGGAADAPEFLLSRRNSSDVTGGDGDGCLEPGETIELPMDVINAGAEASNVVITATSDSTDLIMVNGSVTLGMMYRGTRHTVDPAISLTIDAGCAPMSVHDVTLTVTSTEKTMSQTIQLYVGSGPFLTTDTLCITSDTNNDNLPNPGEGIRFAPIFTNIGCETASGITSEITIDDQWVIEYGIKGDGILPDIAPGIPIIPQKLFYLDLDPMVPDGHVITCEMTFTSASTRTVWEYSLPMTVRDTVMPVISEFTVNPVVPEPGKEATVTIKMQDPAGVQSAEIEISSFDFDQLITAEFYDDGQHNDGAAGDMVFGATITLPDTPCYMSADVTAADNLGNRGIVPNAGGVVTVPFISDDKILVVGRADNDLNIGLYTQALQDAGYGYDVWSYYRGLPTREILDGYVDGAVIMYYSFTYPYLDQTERDLVEYYLNQGGNLLITEQDIGWVMCEAGTSAMADWYHDVLLAEYLEDNAGFQHVEGLSDFSGLEFDIFGGSGADNQDYPSLIEPIAPAETCFVYSDETGVQPGAAGIRADRNGSKHIYLAYGFEGISTQSDRASTMDEMMAWFGMDKTDKMCPFNQIPGPWQGPEISRPMTNMESAFCQSTMRLYHAGGLDIEGNIAEPSIYYTDTVTHQSGDTGVDLNSSRLYTVAACLDDHGTEKIFFLGGFGTDGQIARDIEVFDPAAGTIAILSDDPLPAEIDGICGNTAICANKLYVIGVVRTTEPFQDGQTWVFDPMASPGMRWSMLTTELEHPRFFGATAALDGKIYLMGGIDQISQTEVNFHNTVSVLDTSTSTPQWNDTVAAPMPEAVFFCAGVAVPHGANVQSAGKILVSGGITSSNGNVAFWYDPATDTWTNTWPFHSQRCLQGSLFLVPGARGPAVWAAGGHFGVIRADTEIRYLGDNPTDCWVGVRTCPETIPPGCSLRLGFDIAGDTHATPVDCYIAMEVAGAWFFITADPVFPTFTSDPLPFFAGAPLTEDITYCGPLFEIPFPTDMPSLTGTFYTASLVSGTSDFAGGFASAEFVVP